MQVIHATRRTSRWQVGDSIDTPAVLVLVRLVLMRKANTHIPGKSNYTAERRRKRRRSALKLLGSFVLVVLSLVVVSSENLSSSSGAGTEPLRLGAGSSIRRELNAGQKDAFGISLSPGDLLRFSVHKGDLALSLTLYDPAGQKLFEQVSLHHESLALSAPAEIQGTHLLEIRSLEIGGPARQFELKIEPLGPATLVDQKTYDAQRAAASASVMRADWTEKSLRQAIKKHEEAALIWLSLNSAQRAAAATIQAGEVCLVLGQYQEALNFYLKAAAQAKSAGARVEESRALSETGRLYSYLGDNDEAQRYGMTALRLLAPDGQVVQAAVREDYAASLNNLGEISYSRGDLVKSSRQFEDALKIFDEVGNRNEAARAHLFRGYIAGGLGDRERAVAEIASALAMYRATRNKAGEGLALTALGVGQSSNGDEERAIRIHREAIDIFRSIGDRQSEGIAVNGLGQAYENLTEYSTALENYQQALRLFQSGRSLDFASVATFHVAGAYRLLGDLKQALVYYEKCLLLSRSAKKVRTEANALNMVAVIYADQGNREKTISQYHKILRFYAAISDRRQQAIAWNNLGNSYFRFGEKQQGLISYKRALALSTQTSDKGVLISSLYNVARAQRDLGALDQALANVEQSIKIIEDLRTNVASPDFRTSYFSGVHQHYDLWIDILMQLDRQRPGQGFAATALLGSEKARARSLLDVLTEVRADIRPGADPKLVSRERELRGLLRFQAQSQMELSIDEKDSAHADELARQLNQLTNEYHEVASRLVGQNPRLGSLAPSALSSLEEIQSELRNSDTILFEYALGDERSYVWAVTADSLHSYELPSRSIVEAAGREVYKLLTARQAVVKGIDSDYQASVETSDRLYYEKALELSQMLFGPVAGQLGNKRLVIVSEGILQYIPIDALPEPRGKTVEGSVSEGSQRAAENMPLLLATHEIVTLPSVSTLAAIRKERHEATSTEKVVAVFADPVFSNSDGRVQSRTQNSVIASADSDQKSSQPAVRSLGGVTRQGGPARLVHASEEADAILAVAPRGTGMVARGFDASREAAMSSLVGEYRILHFATHGFINTEHPELSGIVLNMVNQDGSKANGFMSLQDIYNLNLSADVVVLSACDTALGKDIKGEGLVGLTHGFMASGAKSVVATLWKVDDRATAVLMAEFYKSMLEDGLAPAAALRIAKLKIRQERAWQAPYFWAGFVLQGEYNQRITVDRGSSMGTGLTTVLTLALISAGLIIYQRRTRRSYLTRQSPTASGS
jgi:CHAT domain-containing protein